MVPKPIVEMNEGVKMGVISFGSSYEPVRRTSRAKWEDSRLKTRIMIVLAVFLLGLAAACGGSSNIDQGPSGLSQDA